MNQRDLCRAVARVTGETVTEITHRGFQLLEIDPVDPSLEDRAIDWDGYDLRRNVPVFEQRQRRACA